MSVVISDELLQASRLSASELKLEIAVMLFQKKKLFLGQASRLAELDHLEFQHLLASRNLSVHYDVAEFEEDLETLSQLGRRWSFRFIGTLGVLVEAKAQGHLREVKPVLDELRTHAGFHMSEALRARVLQETGE
jgi:predicted HTH domain antitoxin